MPYPADNHLVYGLLHGPQKMHKKGAQDGCFLRLAHAVRLGISQPNDGGLVKWQGRLHAITFYLSLSLFPPPLCLSFSLCLLLSFSLSFTPLLSLSLLLSLPPSPCFACSLPAFGHVDNNIPNALISNRLQLLSWSEY